MQMSVKFALTVTSALFVMLVLPKTAFGQSAIAVSVGSIETTQKCTYFLESEGQSKTAAVVTPYAVGVASSTSWRTWWVKDCVDNFATMRSSLEAALASTGKFSVGRSGYSVNISLSGISDSGAVPPARDNGPGGFEVRSASMLANFNLTLQDRSGAAIYGGLSSKSIETGFSLKADNSYVDTSLTGDAVYGKLQNEMALAMARIVAFKLVPLKVTAVDDDRIELNYGSPLLQLGTLIEVQEQGRLNSIKYRVIATEGQTAVAEADGDYDLSDIQVGAFAKMIEADDPAANGRRYKRNRLP